MSEQTAESRLRMDSPIRQLANNLGTIILALLLAFVVWIAATLQEDPFQPDEFSNVAIQLLNKPKDTVVFNEIAERLNVQVRAPESVLQDLEAGDFRATIDLTDVPLSVHTSVPVSVTCNNEAVRITSFEPAEQTVQLEPIRAVTLPVEIEIEGEPATGYQALRPAITPEEVSLRAPAPILTKVVSVGGIIDVEGAKENIIDMVTILPRDEEGRPVSGLEITPSRVEVRVVVRRRVGYKPDLDVIPDLRGEPATGYRRGIVSVEPPRVTLRGQATVLERLPNFVETLPISVSGATQNLTVRSLLTVPSNVAVVGVDFVTVTIEILPILSSKTVTSVVELQGVRSGLMATASPQVVEVILEGPEAVLSALKPTDVQVLINLADYALGEHRIAPQVLEPAEVKAVSVIPETIEVVIETEPITPTVPTATLPLLLDPQP